MNLRQSHCEKSLYVPYSDLAHRYIFRLVMDQQKIYRWLLKCAVLLVFAVITLWEVDLAEMIGYVRRDTMIAALLVQPICALSLVAAGWRLKFLLHDQRATISVSIKAVSLCYGLNALLPGRASEMLKVIYLRNMAGIAVARGFAAIFLERASDVLMLGILTLVGIVGLAFNVELTILAAIPILIAGLVLVPRLQFPLIKFADRLPRRLQNFAQGFITHTAAQLRDGRFYWALNIATVVWLLAYLQVLLFLHLAGSIPVGMLGAMAVLVAGAVGGAIPVLPGGFGTYEAAVIFALKGYGYTTEEALSIAVVLHASQLLLCVVGALFIALTERIGIHSTAQQIKDLSPYR